MKLCRQAAYMNNLMVGLWRIPIEVSAPYTGTVSFLESIVRRRNVRLLCAIPLNEREILRSIDASMKRFQSSRTFKHSFHKSIPQIQSRVYVHEVCFSIVNIQSSYMYMYGRRPQEILWGAGKYLYC